MCIWGGKRAGNPPVAAVPAGHQPHRPKGATLASWFVPVAGCQYEQHEQVLISFVGIAWKKCSKQKEAKKPLFASIFVF